MGSGLQSSPFYLSPLHHLCKTINVPTCCLYGAGRNDFDVENSMTRVIAHWMGWAQ
jgi:hypothetical protein